MNITELISARSIATQFTTAASNAVPYLGEGLFPAKKKLGLDLKWIKGHKGLPVSLAPSAFDAKSKLRARKGLATETTQMAFFRESMLVKEADEQEVMRLQDTNDPYAQEVVSHIYDDTNNLISGAMVVPERMRMQLLAPADGHPAIYIESDGVTYAYNYDGDGSYAANNFMELKGTAQWKDTENSDPLADVATGIDAVEELTGTKPAMLLIAKKTAGYLRQNAKIKAAILAQNTTANVLITDAKVSEVFQNILGVTIVVYNKKFKDETGAVQQFYPDEFATLLPEGALGSTWYGTTPEERTLMGNSEANVSIVNKGVAITMTVTSDPVNTKTTVSEIVLPSYERMSETYVIKVG